MKPKVHRIADAVREVMSRREIEAKQAAHEIGVSGSAVSRLLTKQHSWLRPDNEQKVLAWLRRHNADLPGPPTPDKSATPLDKPIKLIKIYGMAQALGCRVHHGDVIPENEYDLETIPVIDEGRPLAGFRVEGESMHPTLQEGWIAVCDCEAEPANGDIVVAKWNETATIKRYRRIGDTVLLTSDNQSHGQDYEIHARELVWMLKVVRFVGSL